MKTFLAKINCTIRYNWIIVLLFSVILLIGCSVPNSVRNASSKYKTGKIISKTNIDDKNNLIDTKIEEADTKETSSESDVASLGNAVPSPRKIPSLREQMRIYGDEQEIIKNKISNLESDISFIKNTVNEIKNSLAVAKTEELSTAKPSENYPETKSIKPVKTQAKKKNVILPDEKVSEEQPAHPTKKISNKKSNSTSVKTNLINTSKKEKVKQTAKNDTENIIPDNDEKPEKSNNLDAAMAFFKQKKYESAITEFNKVSLSSGNQSIITICNYWLGESHFGLKQYEKAIQYFQKVIKSGNNTKQDNAQAMLAECYVRSGNIQNAKSAFKNLVDNYPKSIYVPRARKMLQQL